MKDTGRPSALSWVAAFIGYGLLIAGVFLAKAANSTTMVPGYFAAAMVVIMAKLALGRTRLEKRRQLEAEQLEEYRRTHGATDLFEDADEAVRTAARAAEHYTKYFVPVATVLVGLLLIVLGLLRWSAWNRMPGFPVAKTPLAMAAISLALFIASIIAASYFVGVSREKGCRWLRCPGSWMFFAGVTFLGNAFVLVCEHSGRWIEVVDIRTARVAMGILIVLGAELLLSVVVEFYRPRIPGEEERPLPESRLLALFTEPGGVARNLAATLDYQFGFRVSEAKFYRFLERTVVPFSILLVLLLWLQTCLVVVGTEESGLRERFGVYQEASLVPGVYLKLPHPFEKVHLFPIHQIQQLAIGYSDAPDPNKPVSQLEKSAREVVVWARSHRAFEERFLVANRLTADTVRDGGAKTGEAPVSVYLMAASVPLHFRVENLYDYQCRHQDPSGILQRIASRELTNYLAAVDFFSILTSGRKEGADYLMERIQSEADRLRLGVRIVYIGLHGLHPPVEVGSKFDEVAAASEEREEIILKAESYGIKNVLDARGASSALVSAAEAYREDKTRNSAATAARFAKQLLGFRQSPQLFMLNSLLDVFETQGRDVRKFVVAAKSARQVYILDLLEKASTGLMTGTEKAAE